MPKLPPDARLLQRLVPADFWLGNIANEGDVAEVIATLMTQNRAGDDSGERGLILSLNAKTLGGITGCRA